MKVLLLVLLLMFPGNSPEPWCFWFLNNSLASLHWILDLNRFLLAYLASENVDRTWSLELLLPISELCCSGYGEKANGPLPLLILWSCLGYVVWALLGRSTSMGNLCLLKKLWSIAKYVFTEAGAQCSFNQIVYHCKTSFHASVYCDSFLLSSSSLAAL